MIGATGQAGDNEFSKAHGLTTGFQGSMITMELYINKSFPKEILNSNSPSLNSTFDLLIPK